MTLTRTGSPRRLAGTGLASARSRFERRAAAARRAPRLLAALAVGGLLLIGLIAWLGWSSPLLTADRVEVRGVPAAQAASVRAASAVRLGEPLLRVDTGAAVARLRRDPQWAEVSIDRSLPHTVVVTVVPRVAALAVRDAQGRTRLVDRGGFAFRTVGTAPKGVPLVSAGRAQLSPAGVTAALQALDALHAPLRTAVSGMTVTPAEQVRFTLKVNGGQKMVVWGGPGEAAAKARLVEILVKQPGTTIDVSVPSSPVTR